jgi:tetratricopeptide (TPR) repeat protein
MNDVDAAVEQYAAAQELSYRDAIATYLAADTLARFGRLDEARGMLGKAYELEKSTRIQSENAAKEIYSGVARLYEQTQQYDSALATYAEATRSMPRRVVFHVRRAELLLRLERYDEVRTTIGGIRGGEFVDMDEYEYSLQRLAAKLAVAG